MDSNRSRAATLLGVAAAAGAFGVAAMMSAATARADDFSDLATALDEDFAFGQAAFTTSSADFGGGDSSDGLAAFFTGVDDDFLSAPDNVFVATVDALSGEPLGSGAIEWNVSAEPDFANALSDAQFFFGEGQGFYSTAVSDLSIGDYGDAALYDAYGLDYSAILPLEALILGGAASL